VGEVLTANRDELVTKQDIRNIKKQYNITGTERHKDDQLSVCAWVEALEHSPVLFFKPQDIDSTDGVRFFALFSNRVSTRYAETAWEHNCLHGCISHYDFKLISILVIGKESQQMSYIALSVQFVKPLGQYRLAFLCPIVLFNLDQR